MASWASRRKFTYASIVILAIIVFIAIPIFYFTYHAPTCFDSKLNGDETGVDCGGSCSRLCQSAFLPPSIKWGGAKIEKLAEGLYNVATYIENPNIRGGAKDVPYKISLYNKDGILITEREGKVNIYPHRNALAFETAINTNESIPTRATFEFTKAPNWFKSEDDLLGIAVTDKQYNEDTVSFSLEITLENRTLIPYKNIKVGVVLYDVEGNVMGFSQTFIDEISAKNGRAIAPYTWPINRNGRVATIEVLITTVPTLVK